MNIGTTGCGGLERIKLAQNRLKWLAFVHTVMTV